MVCTSIRRTMDGHCIIRQPADNKTTQSDNSIQTVETPSSARTFLSSTIFISVDGDAAILEEDGALDDAVFLDEVNGAS